MASHVNHHYVPVFLLKGWVSRADEKLSVYKLLPSGELQHDRLGPKAVAKEAHLYSLNRTEAAPDTNIETDVLAKDVDDPASLVHKDILEHGLKALTDKQRDDWSRFLLASLLRIPWMVAHFRSYGRQELIAQFEAMASHAGQPEAAQAIQAPDFKDVLDDHGMGTFVRALKSKKHLDWIAGAAWSVVTLSKGVDDALIGDSPVAYFGELFENEFALVTPISPRHLFLCASNDHYRQRLGTMKPKDMLKATNKRLVQHAADYVYATNQTHQPLIQKYLGNAKRILEAKSPLQAGLRGAEAA